MTITTESIMILVVENLEEIINWFNDTLIRYENNEPIHFSEPSVKCRDCEYKSLDIEKKWLL
jgi:hypothetical protein